MSRAGTALRWLGNICWALALVIALLAILSLVLPRDADAAVPEFDWSCLILETEAVPPTFDVSLTHSVSVFFDFDRAEVRPADLSRIRDFVEQVRDLPGAVQMSAHTDRRGTDDYNVGLSERRLQAVSEALVGLGIDAGRITGRSWGESRALIEEALTDDERQPDRRADVITVEVVPGDPGRPATRRVLLKVPEDYGRATRKTQQALSVTSWEFRF